MHVTFNLRPTTYRLAAIQDKNEDEDNTDPNNRAGTSQQFLRSKPPIQTGFAERCTQSTSTAPQPESYANARMKFHKYRAPRNINEAMSLDCGSSTFGSCSQSEFRHDSELDIRVMRTLNDVKFRHRPKFPVFGDVNFQRECLEAHNAVRQRHGCPPLEWSQELADLARTWAERLVEKGRILYPELPGLGENIYLGSARELSHLPSGQEVGERWANEHDKHDYDKPRWRPDSQHFTQMVWRVTYEMGASRCWLPKINQFAIVCFYRPGGNSNSPGEFTLNVPRPLSPSELAEFDSVVPVGLGRNNNSVNQNNSDNSPVGELPGAFRRKLLISDSPPQSTVSDSHFLCKRGTANNGKYKQLTRGKQQTANHCYTTVSCSDGPDTTSGSAKSTPAKRKNTSSSSKRARFWLWNRFRRQRQPPDETSQQPRDTNSKQSTSKQQSAAQQSTK